MIKNIFGYKICCEKFEKSIEDGFIEIYSNVGFFLNYLDDYMFETEEIKYCPFCGNEIEYHL